jgi:hypothetical protein
MALRDASEVGVPDVRRFSDLRVTDGSPEPVAPHVTRPKRAQHLDAKATPVVSARAKSPPTPQAQSSSSRSAAALPERQVLLGDERLVYLQADVPDAVLLRVKEVSFELAGEHPRLARHQTILGALVWTHVNHTDEHCLADLATLIDAYRGSPWHGLPEPRRLSGRMPAGLKRRVDGSVLALSLTQRDVSAKRLVAALVWRHVRSARDDAAGFAALLETVAAYHDAISERSHSAPSARQVA